MVISMAESKKNVSLKSFAVKLDVYRKKGRPNEFLKS
jgi:hypothetical protein